MKRKRERQLVPLAGGELELIRRALRVYMNAEQAAIQLAAVAARAYPRSTKHMHHAADVKRQCEPRILMAGYLMDRLLKNPLLEKKEEPLPVIENGVCPECHEFFVHKPHCGKDQRRQA